MHREATFFVFWIERLRLPSLWPRESEREREEREKRESVCVSERSSKSKSLYLNCVWGGERGGVCVGGREPTCALLTKNKTKKAAPTSPVAASCFVVMLLCVCVCVCEPVCVCVCACVCVLTDWEY